MDNKNAPKHNNVIYANGVPYLIFEYKPIKFGRKHMKSEVGTLNLTTNKRRIVSEFFKDSAIYCVHGALLEHLTDLMVMGEMNNINLTF